MFLAVVIVFSLGSIGVFANDTSTVEGYTEFPVIQVSENASQEEIETALDKAMQESLLDEPRDQSTLANGTFVINPFLIRSGNTTSCQLSLKWQVTGGYLLSGIAFDSVVLHNGSKLFPVIYSNIGRSYLPCPASSQGSVFVLNVTIPLNTTSTGMKAYIIGEGWISGLNLTGTVPFN